MDTQQIEAIRSQTLSQIESLLATSGPTISVGTEQVAWAPLLAPLYRTVDWCNEKLAECQPFEVQSLGET